MEPNDAKRLATVLIVAFAVMLPLCLYVKIMLPYWLSKPDDATDGAATAAAGDGDAGEELTKIPEDKRATLTFKDVQYEYTDKTWCKTKSVTLLKGVSGMFEQSTLTAIMGPSGCGKSTLLDILADTKATGTVKADIRLNGDPRPANYRSIAAYVMQTDVAHKKLTVRETLNFAAVLRMKKPTREERIKRVNETLRDVSLTKFADTIIGDDVSGGLSGGQRRRVTVAIELINRPALLFLDEPTSGLDAYGAMEVVTALRKLGDRGHTIACTIHQPREQLFRLFDQLLLMSVVERVGKVMYYGTISGIYPYFERAGVPCDHSVNPADFIVDLTHSTEHSEDSHGGGGGGGGGGDGKVRPPTVAQLVAMYAEHEQAKQLLGRIERFNEGSAVGSDPSQLTRGPSSIANAIAFKKNMYANGLFSQVRVLTRRMFLNDWREKTLFAAFIANGIVLGFQGLTYVMIVQPPATPKLNGSTFAYYGDAFASQGVCELDPGLAAADGLNQDVVDCGTALVSQIGVTHAHEALLFMLLNALFVNELIFTGAICDEKPIFRREHGANSYSAAAWHIAFMIKMLCQAALKLIFYPPMYYFAARLKLSLTSYLVAAFLTGGMGFAGSATSMLVAAVAPENQTATTMFNFLVIVMQNVCGFYISLDVVPSGVRWLSHISFYYYGYEMFRSTQVETDRLWSSSYEVAWVFALSTMVYVFAFAYHLIAFLATNYHTRPRVKYIDTGSSAATAAAAAAAATAAKSAASSPTSTVVLADA